MGIGFGGMDIVMKICFFAYLLSWPKSDFNFMKITLTRVYKIGWKMQIETGH